MTNQTSHRKGISRAVIAIVVIVIIIIVGAAAYYLTLPTPTPTPTPTPKEPIKIGVITPLSAPADYLSGELILENAEIFVEWQNAKGGVLGRKLELVTADQTLDPATAISALERLVTHDKIVGLVGPWESLVALPLAEATDSFPVINFYSYSWADGITKNHYKYAFRVGIYNSLFASHLVNFLEFKGYKNIVSFTEESSYGLGNRDALLEETATKIPDLEFTDFVVPQARTDFTPEIAKIAAMDPLPETCLIILNLPTSLLVHKQLTEAGLHTKIQILYGNDGPTWVIDQFWETVGEEAVGSLYPAYYSPQMKLTSTGEEYFKIYKGKTGKTPAIWLGWYWDGLRILVEAIEKTGSTNPDVLANYIEDIEIEGTSGRITFINDPTPGSVKWHQWIGQTQFIFQFTEFGQEPLDAEQIYPPL